MDNNTNAMYDIAKNNAGIPAVGAIFNVYAGKFESFITDFLETKGVTGVNAVQLFVYDINTNRARPAIYLFLKRDTNIVGSNKSKVPSYLMNKVEGAKNVHINDCGREKLASLIDFKNLNCGVQDGEVFIELDIFRAIGLYLAASYNQHRLNIFEINLVNNEIVLTVIKQEIPKTSFGVGRSDKRTAFIERQRRYNGRY